MKALEDRIFACLAGLALGDALGAPVEFMTPEQIAAHFGWVSDFVRAPAWHPHQRLAPGRVTDDTGQALAIVRAYSDDGKLSLAAVARELLAWKASLSPEDLQVVIGPSTTRAFEQLEQGADPAESGRQGRTNGAAMRAAVAGLTHPGDPDAALADAVQASLPTHGAGPAIAGAAAVACAVAVALDEGATLRGILEAAKDGAQRGAGYGAWAWSTPLEARIELAEQVVLAAADERAALRSLYETVGVDMLVSESVAAAFGVLVASRGDPMRAVTLGANIGGDTDTIAAIAGAVCGAWQGSAGLDAGLLERLEAANQLDLRGAAARLAHIAARRGQISGG